MKKLLIATAAPVVMAASCCGKKGISMKKGKCCFDDMDMKISKHRS